MFVVMFDIWADGDTLRIDVGDVFADFNNAMDAAQAAVKMEDDPQWGWCGTDAWVLLATPEGYTNV